LWTIVSSFIFGGLLVGGNAVQRAVQVPSSLIVALNGLVVIFVVSIEYLRRKARNRPPSTHTDPQADPSPAPASPASASIAEPSSTLGMPLQAVAPESVET
jgi:hypothetical protein